MSTKQMAQILSGNFSAGKDAITGKDKKGNFQGKNESGDRVFISKQLMESLGFTTDADLKKDGKFTKNLFVIYTDATIPQADASGEFTLTATRTEACSVFSSEDEMINAYTASDRRKIIAQGSLMTLASTAGLTDANVNAILTASI